VAASNVFCTTAAGFTADLHQPPKLTLAATAGVRARRSTRIRLTLSKISEITMTAVRAGRTMSSETAQIGHGTHMLSWTPTQPGRYTISVSATDLAGNRARTSLSLSVAAAPRGRYQRR
jgi:uncharacterized protein YfaS (alpha-2-macroglobulin family)